MSSLSLLALAAIPFLSQLAHAQSCAPVSNVKITYYGFPDGPGDTTSFGCSGSTMVASTSQSPPTAGGSGSYEDPFTLATQAGSSNIKECELVYIPYLKKYFRYMDHCTGCDSNHIDLWIGSDTNGGAAQIACEQDLGTSQQGIVVNPPSGLPVNAQNLWDGTCHTDQTFPGGDASSACSGGGGSTGGSASSSAASPPPASSSAAAVAPPPSTTAAAASPPPPPQQQQQQQQQPTSSPPANPGKSIFGAQKQVVQPARTTLQTIATPVAPSNEPTGTPIATNDGVCPNPGAAVCSADGKQIGICNSDKTVIFVDVAAGTKCQNGAMVFADA